MPRLPDAPDADTLTLTVQDKAAQLFRAFAPMLCKRPTRRIEESVKDMQGQTFVMEEKLDGERMQLHKRGNEYFYCSRKGKDYTYLYGKHVGTGSLTPFIHGAFDSRVDEIILDGEMLVWDPVSERNLPFGTLKTAALDKSKKAASPRPCFKVFDLLYLNGLSLLHKSLKFRKRNLRSCLREVPGRIEFVQESEGKTAKDVRARMDQIMANRGEGLVMKHPDSEYVLNGRNRDWIKVKPEYMDNMGETVDVLVVAGNYGTGRRSGGVSTLICAVLDDRRPSDDDEPKYSTFVRIGTGLSYADYIWVRQKPWKDWDPKNPPSFLQVAKKGTEDKGDIYLEPEDSFIVKVKAAEITTTDLYHMGLTMRFPRALQIRDDLDTSDCMAATTVLESLRSERKRKMDPSDDKPKKKQKKIRKPVTVMPEYRGISLKDVEVESELFEGMKFMVASDPKSRTGEKDKSELMKLIYANGGSCAQVARDDSKLLVVYGGTSTPYDIKLIMDKGVCDIIRPQWIMDCIARGELVPLTKKYFFHATARRRNDEDYDMDADTEEEEEPEQPTTSSTTPATQPIDEDDDKTESEEEDPELADWFNVKKASKRSEVQRPILNSDTEADSDNEDVNRDEDIHSDEDEGDDWVDVKPTDPSASSPIDAASLEDAHISQPERDDRMGEDDTAMEYDQELIFKHLFERVANAIKENGGRVADLDDPKLTHVVVDKRDASRRLELIQRTSKPKRRHLVISQFIQACLDEATLLDEEEFAP
ncbi:hypothetical protein EVJ58_g8059 [Rhodofomes roseus]|uniref:DNA ligase n=1 Tax=Rhodofomes roseus TaxID=34475 RepID=A0A4Y9Y2D5_9APHY|nr:hypothetical protein EVJ58_g8059 [Rhodofomes roseus]